MFKPSTKIIGKHRQGNYVNIRLYSFFRTHRLDVHQQWLCSGTSQNGFLFVFSLLHEFCLVDKLCILLSRKHLPIVYKREKSPKEQEPCFFPITFVPSTFVVQPFLLWPTNPAFKPGINENKNRKKYLKLRYHHSVQKISKVVL